MNYGELKTAVVAGAHRADLLARAPDFIRECEGMIRRTLKYALPLTATLDESDRAALGVYNLPDGLALVRSIRVADGNVMRALEQKSLAEIGGIHGGASVQWFAVLGGGQVEFRGVPAENTELELRYMGVPDALDGDGDTNDLLANHETIYLSGSRFFLYKHTQDIELAQGELDVFTAAIDTLNEQQARLLGGASVRRSYHFGPLTRGY